MHDPRYWQYTFHGELTARNTFQPQTQSETFLQQFDADGNVSQRFLYVTELSGGYDADDQVRNYYDAANRLRATQHYLDVASGVDHGTFDEYEYDALGRRIVVISRRNDNMPACHPSIVLCIQSICNQQATCTSSLTRYAWDGNQTLVEDRQPFGSASYGSDDGYVTYVHGAEVDRPLGVIDTRVSGSLRVPHPTWRGMYESSSTASGAPADCSLTTNTCSLVAWNASNSLYKLDSPSDAHVTTTYTWVGGLLMNQQDATGLLYRRNRYYDPMSGRFSQEDPVGLAGGLNVYGFAGGDPLNYSDPFGLCPWCFTAIFNWWLAEGGPAVARIGAALSGLSLPGSTSDVTTTYRSVEANPRAAATIERLTATFEGNIDKLDEMHLDAAAREAKNEVVAWKESAERAYDHVTEVRNAMQGMRNVISAVNRLLKNGRPSEAQAAAAEALKQKAIDALRRAQEAGVTRQ